MLTEGDLSLAKGQRVEASLPGRRGLVASMFESKFMQICGYSHIKRFGKASHYVNGVSAAFVNTSHKRWQGSFDFAQDDIKA